MRRPSEIDRAKQLERIERARRMTPEARLLACVQISTMVLQLQQAGKRDRDAALSKPR